MIRPPKKNEGETEYKTFLKQSRQARSIIVQALGDRPLRAVQSENSVRQMWTKLFDRCASTKQHNKIIVLAILINMKLKSPNDISDHVSRMESLFNQLGKMDLEVEAQMQVALLLVSVDNVKLFSPTIAAIKVMKDENASWKYVSTRLIKEGSVQPTTSFKFGFKVS